MCIRDSLLCDKADDVYNGRLPVHVRCLRDEFANIGQIPKFDKLIATIRIREISASIILQSQSCLLYTSSKSDTMRPDRSFSVSGLIHVILMIQSKERSCFYESHTGI